MTGSGWGTFSSTTGFKDYEYSYVEDFDGSLLALFTYGQDQEGDYFEQEFRVTSNTDGPLSWYAGVSYYKENVDTIFFGVQDEDVYCATYWSYYGVYYQHANCQEVWDYYNYLGAPDVYHPDDHYYRGAYAYDYCCYMNAYYLQYFLRKFLLIKVVTNAQADVKGVVKLITQIDVARITAVFADNTVSVIHQA